MRMTISKNTVELILILAFLFLIPWSVSAGLVGYALATLLFVMLAGINVLRITKRNELTITLCIPIILSAFQNIGLGIFSPYLSKTEVQFLTILNFLYAAIVFVTLLLGNYKKKIAKSNTNRKIWIVFFLVILYSLFSIVFASNRNILSIVSSLRNIVSMFLFYFIGILASEKVSEKKLEKVMMVIGIFVIAVGLYEIIINPSMWRSLNITELWTKKGIRVQASGLPTNFYSSETINGQRIRRMTASFADPVNLGAYLFVLFMIAWFRDKKITRWIIAVAIGLTVSKGAFLGILIFITVYAYFHYSRPVFLVSLVMSLGIGLAFLLYASRTSANSVFLHASGLTAAFRDLIRNPLGSGLGSNGVLARQFSSYSSNYDITETGLGMIIAQLGIIGLFLFIAFFINTTKICFRISDERTKILCLTLLISIMTNMFFNEVALSPNSCAAYFMIIGVYIGKIDQDNIAREA